MVLGAFLFALMAVCIKFAAQHFNTLEIVAYRGLIGAVVLLAFMRGKVTLATPVPVMHLWRTVVGVLALIAWFYAISELPLGTAMTLNYMSSIWIATFLLGGALLLPNRLPDIRQQSPLFLTVIVGFIGVGLVLRPSFENQQALPALVGLASGLSSALAYMQVAALSRVGEPETRTVFYFSLGATLVGFGGTLIYGTSTWSWSGALWLLPVGLLALGGQLCMTRAYASGATLLVANLQYFGIVFATLFGLVIFSDQLPLMGWLGMLLIVASGILATILRQRAVPKLPAEEHA